MNDPRKMPPHIAGSDDDVAQIQLVSNPARNFAEEIGTAIKHTAALDCSEIEPMANDYA